MIFCAPFSAFCQRELQEQITFSNRVINPVKVEVEATGDKIIFYGVNNSFLPYQLEITFTQILNLDPPSKYYKTVIDPGRTRLFELQIRQKNSAMSYNYNIRYCMGDPDEVPDAEFPYLIPLARNKRVNIEVVNQIMGVSPALFKLAKGDTIYSMRRGKVTATPQSDVEIDRLTQASVEVYHKDGTLASYYGVNLDCLVKAGETIYPGQAIGIMKDDMAVSINVYQFLKNNKIHPIPIKYTIDGTSLLVLGQLKGISVNHPANVIQKELRKPEMKKWQKGNLYE